jgi:hypothetical protein
MRGEEHPRIEKRDGRVEEEVETHPAYGQITASRVSSSPRTLLYGSEFGHGHYIVVTIKGSELHRSVGRDWHMARDEIISVALSESQWATFLSTLNHGSGSCCTIEHVLRKQVPAIASKKDRHKQFGSEVNDRFEKGCTRGDQREQVSVAESEGHSTQRDGYRPSQHH